MLDGIHTFAPSLPHLALNDENKKNTLCAKFHVFERVLSMEIYHGPPCKHWAHETWLPTQHAYVVEKNHRFSSYVQQPRYEKQISRRTVFRVFEGVSSVEFRHWAWRHRRHAHATCAIGKQTAWQTTWNSNHMSGNSIGLRAATNVGGFWRGFPPQISKKVPNKRALGVLLTDSENRAAVTRMGAPLARKRQRIGNGVDFEEKQCRRRLQNIWTNARWKVVHLQVTFLSFFGALPHTQHTEMWQPFVNGCFTVRIK